MRSSSAYALQTKRNAGWQGLSSEGALSISSVASKSSSRVRWSVPLLSAPAGGIQFRRA